MTLPFRSGNESTHGLILEYLAMKQELWKRVDERRKIMAKRSSNIPGGIEVSQELALASLYKEVANHMATTGSIDLEAIIQRTKREWSRNHSQAETPGWWVARGANEGNYRPRRCTHCGYCTDCGRPGSMDQDYEGWYPTDRAATSGRGTRPI